MAATLPTDSPPLVVGGAGPSSLPQQEATKRTSRKQWSSIQGGPRGLLRRMRSQMAEDGCPESQLVMGRTLLEQLDHDGNDGGEGEEGARLAVFWLTRASLQGSQEATMLLTHCLHNNIGICEHNFYEVRECLARDLQEKLARRAAHMLFYSLSDGNEVISSGRLGTKVAEIINPNHHHDDQETDVVSEGGLEELYGGERFTEEHLLSAAVLYCQGRLPPLHHFLPTQPTPAPTPSLLRHTTRWPVRMFCTIYESSVTFLGFTLISQAGRLSSAVTPVTGSLVMCLVAALLSLCGTTKVVAVLLLAALSLAALVFMVASTARVLLNRRRFDSFRIWSHVFSHFCPELDVAQAEAKFESGCRRPYIVASGAVLVYLATVPLTSHNLATVCLPVMVACAVLTFLLLPERLTGWQVVSLGLYLAAITPGVQAAAGGYLHMLTEGTGLQQVLAYAQFEVLGRFTIHVGVGPLLHMLWCCVQVYIGVVCGLTHLPPHLLSLVWWHLSVLAGQGVSSPVEVVYPLAGWSMVVLLPTLAPWLLLLAPVALCMGVSMQVALSYHWLVLVFLLGVLALWCCRCCWSKLVLVFKLVLVAGMVTILLQPGLLARPSPLKYSSLQWESFRNVCLPSKDMEVDTITHGCLPLQGTVVRWKGSVSRITIARVRNIPRALLSLLPSILEGPFRCYLGQRLAPCPGSKVATTESERCQLLHSVLGPDACTLDAWDEYNFEVRLTMPSSYWKFGINQESDVVLRADNTFRDFVLRLSVGDQVEFVASLTDGVGTQQPELDLSAVRCVNCKVKLGFVQVDQPADSNITAVPPFIFNFFLGPTLTL